MVSGTVPRCGQCHTAELQDDPSASTLLLDSPQSSCSHPSPCLLQPTYNAASEARDFFNMQKTKTTQVRSLAQRASWASNHFSFSVVDTNLKCAGADTAHCSSYSGCGLQVFVCCMGNRGEKTETIHQLFPVELLKAAALLPQVGCEWGK